MPANRRSAWDALRVAAAVAIGTLVMLRATVFFAPQLVFDVDPVLDPSPIVGFGPAASMAIDALIWLCCAIGLFAEARSGRRIDLLMLLLALAGLPIVIWHGHSHLGNLWIGVSWSAAMMAALTVAHLARDRQIRVLLVALGVAAVTAILVRGLSQLTYEHERIVADFHVKREAFFAAQGWAPDSVQAQIYERRLEQNQPTGWFTTTNILGSFAAAVIALWLSLALGLWRHFGWRNVAFVVLSMFVLIAVAGAELWKTTSKGALAAAGLGVMLVLTAHLFIRLRKRWQLTPKASARLGYLGGAAVLALIALAIAGIIARGTLLPENALGDKSLLFRWFYMQAAIDMLREHWMLGTGPDRFQEIFLQFRPPRCPEEVTSAHNVFLDYAVTLGMADIAWIGFLIVLAARAGARLLTENDTPANEAAANSRESRTALILVATSVMIGLGASFIVESRSIDAAPLEMWRGAGIIIALLVALLTMRAAMMVSPAVLSIGLGSAAAVLLVHAQIEMTLTQPGSAGLALVYIALAATAGVGQRRKIVFVISLLLALVATWLAAYAIVPAWQQQQMMIEAARSLDAIQPEDRPTPAQVIAARAEAATTLREALGVLPTNPDPPYAAAQQLFMAADFETGERKAALLREAIAFAELSIDTVSLPSYHALMANLHRALARTGEETAWNDAVAHAQELTRRDPNGLSAWKLLGDIAYEWNRADIAIGAYARTLAIDRNMELDELKRLRDADRAEIERRLRELRN